jgi:hypothetical protein
MLILMYASVCVLNDKLSVHTTLSVVLKTHVRAKYRRKLTTRVEKNISEPLGPGVYSASSGNEYQKQKNMFLGS